MSERENRHWDTVAIGIMTIATIIVVGMFGLLGFSGGESASGAARTVNAVKLLLAAFALPAYIFCLGFGTDVIMDVSGIPGRKIAKCRHLINTFLVTAVMVGLVAALTVIGQLDG